MNFTNKTLRIGVEDITGEFLPFYASTAGDIEVMSQIFQTVQRRSTDNSFVNNAGGISYELVNDTQVKYTVTIRDDLSFSDGTKVKIDDVIFFYHYVADASYDGIYSDWYLNDIEGLKEFYYDDVDYESSLREIDEKVAADYTVATISVEDYAEYLVATKLEGSYTNFAGSAPNGKPWSDYLLELGYEEAIKDLGNSPTQQDLLQLVAKAEAEVNPNGYNPESWYKDKFINEYINKNYNDGIDVSTISGIKKINDYACTVLFNSANINAISELNAYIVPSQNYYVDYIKGGTSAFRESQPDILGSGPYSLNKFEDGSVSLISNAYSQITDISFTSVTFTDVNTIEMSLEEALTQNKVDIIKTDATSTLLNSLDSKKFKYSVTNNPYYVSVFANHNTLDDAARKGLFGLFDASEMLDSQFGTCYTALYTPLSIRFPEYSKDVDKPYYSKSAFDAYKVLATNPITELNFYYVGTEADFGYKLIEKYASIIRANGIEVKIKLTNEDGLLEAITFNKADMWLSTVYDGPTCDKYDYYNSSGIFNYTGIKDPEIDNLTASVRNSVGLVNRTELTKTLLDTVMHQAVELPIYQGQTVTVYNLETVLEDSISTVNDYDGYTHLIPLLKQN